MPSTPAERRALAVIAAIAALGVVVRVVRSRAATPTPTAAEVLALDAQIERVRAAREGTFGKSKSRSTRSTSSTSEPAKSSTTRLASQKPRELVDLDTAGLETIEGLPWIGPALAARIIESRERCGTFGSMEALTRVYGIGAGMAKRLEPYVTFSTPSRPMDAARAEGCSSTARGAAPRRRGRS